MGERDVDAGDLEQLRGPSGILCSFLVRCNLLAILSDLGGRSDEGKEQCKPLAECGDVVVDLEEQVVLHPLGETGAEKENLISVDAQAQRASNSQNVALDVGGIEGGNGGGHDGIKCIWNEEGRQGKSPIEEDKRRTSMKRRELGNEGLLLGLLCWTHSANWNAGALPMVLIRAIEGVISQVADLERAASVHCDRRTAMRERLGSAE